MWERKDYEETKTLFDIGTSIYHFVFRDISYSLDYAVDICFKKLQ